MEGEEGEGRKIEGKEGEGSELEGRTPSFYVQDKSF